MQRTPLPRDLSDGSGLLNLMPAMIALRSMELFTTGEIPCHRMIRIQTAGVTLKLFMQSLRNMTRKKVIELPQCIRDEFLRLLDVDKAIATRYLKREMEKARARATRNLPK